MRSGVAVAPSRLVTGSPGRTSTPTKTSTDSSTSNPATPASLVPTVRITARSPQPGLAQVRVLERVVHLDTRHRGVREAQHVAEPPDDPVAAVGHHLLRRPPRR